MNQFLLPLIFVLAFLAVATLAQVVFTAFSSVQARTKRVNRRLTLQASGMGHREVYEALVRRRAAPKIDNASILDVYNRAQQFTSQAGLQISPFRLLGVWIGAAVGVCLLATLILRASGAAMGAPDILVSLFGSLLLTGLSVFTFVSVKRSRRMRTLEEQLPLALDIVVRSLRAGHPVVSALQLVTSEMGDPIGSEFGLIVDETTYGFELREALANFARRTGSEDAHFFAVSVSIQSETGGNLAEILENLSKVIRARITLGKRVKALSSEGRMSAIILSILPLFLIGSIALSQPMFYVDKFNEPIFWPIVTAILSLYLVGLLIMHRIANFKY